MNVSGSIFLIDHKKFTSQVIPALLEGELNIIVRESIKSLKRKGLFALHNFEGLSAVMSTFNKDFTDSTLGKEFRVKDGIIEKSARKLEFSERSFWDYYDLNILFEKILFENAVESFINFGENIQYPEKFVSHPDPKIYELIHNLGKRSSFWRHSSGGLGEGIYDWLDLNQIQILNNSASGLILNEEIKEKNILYKFNSFKNIIRRAANTNNTVAWGVDLRILSETDQEGTTQGDIIRLKV